jgi:PleD family two-component response regulator
VLARVRAYQRLKTLSDTLRGAVSMDFLTGAVTRRQLEKVLTQEWLRAQRSAAPLAVLLADIDGFTAYNAEFGEEKGDACLHSIADALRAAAHRPTDVLGRFAGGNFALVLPPRRFRLESHQERKPCVYSAAYIRLGTERPCQASEQYRQVAWVTYRRSFRPESL